jgi:transcriptional regulator with GAF, ATPase, and Fis domain
VTYFTDASVLIMGETGTGKELVARLIHSLDPRAKDQEELVILDCSTIVPELAGSEFFGHERGAFTGALMAREGAFALANGGTLFLDEVGELPLPLQVQLLRVIQEGTYKKIGSNTWKTTHFRLVCATNRDLSEEVAKGRFRADLFYRIATWSFRLPPLRERKEDVLPLALHFLESYCPQENPPLDIDEPLRHYLLQRDYPGNIRELMQLMHRLGSRHVGPGPITLGDIPENERRGNMVFPNEWHDARFEQSIRDALMLGYGIKEIGRITSDTVIRIVLREEDGNLQRAAKRLGITDRALQLRQASQRSNLNNDKVKASAY